MNESNRNLVSGFLNSVNKYPNNIALEVERKKLSYQQLFNKAAIIAATLNKNALKGESSLTAVFASRSITAFAGILSALMRGHIYVPLNRIFPSYRTKFMLKRSGCQTIIVDAASAEQLNEILEDMDEIFLILIPDSENVDFLSQKWPQHKFLGKNDLITEESFVPSLAETNSIAYLLFTSGSTGVPKGVMVSHQNVLSFIDFIVERYEITEKDRLSQTFDITFDLSVFDMFAAWECGARVCCPTRKELIKPEKYIQNSQLTIWFSVPSTAIFMKRLNTFKKFSFPSIRLSLFCGEPLPKEVVRAWSKAVPNSIVENLYGPTELTIACTYYRWNSKSSEKDDERDILPIGYPFPGMSVLVVDDDLNEVLEGAQGELLMSGPQVALGYWKEHEKTMKSYVIPAGKKETFYRTGDIVRRPFGNNPLIYVGRKDSQIKVLGYRVELGEIETVVREESGIDAVVALGWPVSISSAQGIEVFVEGDKKNLVVKDLRTRISLKLPEYMVPRKFHMLKEFPLNVNGKIDRKSLQKILENQ